MKSTCKRAWEVEALEDGRLRDKDRASLERHAETCADCTKARARIQELGPLLAEVPVPASTDLEHRRARAELLSRADVAILGGRVSPFPKLLAVAVGVAVFALAFTLHRRHEDARDAAHTAATSTLTAPPPAVVDTSAPAPSIVPATTSTVAAVQPTDVASSAPPTPRLPKTEAASATVPNVAPSTAMATPSSAAANARALAGERFARAMSSFNAGDYGEADRAFVAFVRDFPADSRAEDAMFLVADARARRGDTAGAREAAKAYLRRFPGGLRAPAAERLAADPH